MVNRRRAMNSLRAELMEDHVRFHALDPNKKFGSDQPLAAGKLVDIIGPT